ncbi:MAG: endolytic transglycosylase MltG [Acidiferrobacterales bacterium]|nr:endolytic transglycosylase MltG [Acidiferrobacterales bacterium]
MAAPTVRLYSARFEEEFLYSLDIADVLYDVFHIVIKNIFIRLIVPLAIISAMLVAGAYWYYSKAIVSDLNLDEDIFVIERGATINGLAARFVEEGKLNEPWSMRLLARQEFPGKAIQAGEYDFPKDLTLRSFLEHIVSGKGQVDMRITVVEGWTFRQMREAIYAANKIRHVTKDWPDQQIMEALGHPELHPEGQFFPDTYHYRADEPDLVVFRKSFNLMQEKLDELWPLRNDELLLKTPYEVLILASIIEKETQVRDEQPTIAGVFMNRLRKGMRLQTDPTVIYGVGDAYKGDITRKHLKTDTPYNTYTRSGLTPTPISLPGEDSLLAAVQPAKTDAYYFVASGGGRHKFSRTLAEHNKAVKEYLRRQKSQ